MTFDDGQSHEISTTDVVAERIATQLQRRLAGKDPTQVRFPFEENEPAHYLVIDSGRLVSLSVTPI